jgi:hypothetical protein
MKKTILLLTLISILSLTGCGEKSAIQKATGASSSQGRDIEAAILDAGIEYETIDAAPANKDIDEELSDQYSAYLLKDRDGKEYTMIIDNDKMAVLTINDAENNGLKYSGDSILDLLQVDEPEE